MGLDEEACVYYKQRAEIAQGFFEERYHSYYKSGELSEKLGETWENCINMYLKAFQIIARAEPVNKIAKHYISKQEWKTAYMFSKMACDLPFPNDNMLFVDKLVYDYDRWHNLSVCAFYAGFAKEGYVACLKACEFGKEIDQKNLKFYEEKIKDMQNSQNNNQNQVDEKTSQSSSSRRPRMPKTAPGRRFGRR
jgi:hypothetical protein